MLITTKNLVRLSLLITFEYKPEREGYVELPPALAGQEGFQCVLHAPIAGHQVQHAESQIIAPPSGQVSNYRTTVTNMPGENEDRRELFDELYTSEECALRRLWIPNKDHLTMNFSGNQYY